jgi:hypothetical protein
VREERSELTDRIQSRRVFFFKNFLVRYLRYRLENGTLDVTVIFVLPRVDVDAMCPNP